MGLVSTILNFYSYYSLLKVHNNIYQSIEDCIERLSTQEFDLDLITILSIVKKFEHIGIIIRVGQKGDDPVLGATYIAQNLSEDNLKYGSYEFYYYGFNSIRNRFSRSVLPIEVTLCDESKGIGTCFIIDSNIILTAKHCIENKEDVTILDPYGQFVEPLKIWTPTDDVDIALIEMKYYNFNSVPKFKIESGDILEDILTMGYPPIPGFNAIQVADISHVNSAIKFSKGKIIGEDQPLWEKDSYYLINARVKGGNSGGPIINNLGYVIGMVVHVSVDSNDQEKLDHLAYGVAVTGNRLSKFISDIGQKNENVSEMKFTLNKKGFKTS